MVAEKVRRSPGLAGTALFAAALAAAAPGGAAPPNDRFDAAAELEGSSGQVAVSSDGATREAGEPPHAGTGGSSVWWRWRAPAPGGARFDTLASDFDTVLAVYTGDSLGALRLVSSSDDRGDVLQSAVGFEVVEGEEYRIAVDGYDGEQGRVVLSWSAVSVPCELPLPPGAPSPADGERAPLPVTLRWNVPKDVRIERRVIYGTDDRREVFEVTDPDVLEAARSTVALVDRSDLGSGPGGAITFRSRTLAEVYGVCEDERFADQPAGAWCSGFLAAPDVVVTAGHCLLTDEECASTAFLFDYHVRADGSARLELDPSEVYFCDQVLASEESTAGDDWAVVRLDRPVEGRTPLRVRRSGRVGDRQDLILIGHPSGLPTKVAGGARVRDNTGPAHFIANLDAYAGNSGSAVIDADTLLVEGVLVRGEEDYVERNGCQVSVRCADDGCAGEDVTRATRFDALIAAGGEVSYTVQFGACGRLTPRGETQGTSWDLFNLAEGAEYCWQVIARNACGESAGPVWRFTTGSPGGIFRRGDVSPDGAVNISDSIAILQHLFGAGIPLPCARTADADDSGELNLTDAVFILAYLFLGDESPPEPFSSCGTDSTPDELPCEGGGCV